MKDVEFERREIIVREGRGNKDRVTVLPENLIEPWRRQMESARKRHQSDLADGFCAVLNKGGRGVLSPFDQL